MEPKELMQAVKELIDAKTSEEKINVLQRHPEILNKENIDQFRQIATMARLSSGEKVASVLEKVAEMLAGWGQNIYKSSKVTVSTYQPVNPQTTVPWFRIAREYLASRKKERLEQAIVSAEEGGENEIASLLRAWQGRNFQIFAEHAPNLYKKLLASGRSEEAWTVDLLYVDITVSMVGYIIHLPLEQQAQALDMGIQACQKAIDFANRLGDQACKAFYLDAAGNTYFKSRRFKAAEAAYQDALTIRRKLAKEQPQVYESDVAVTLNNLGALLGSLRRLEAAEASFRESLTIRRKLVKEQPQVYESDVAMTLSNLGNVLLNLHRNEAAETVYQEALMLFRKLAKEQPQVYESDIAATLNKLGTVLSFLRHLEAAEASFRESLTIRRKLAKKRPQNESDVAGTLNNLGVVLRDLRHLEAAEAAFQEALMLFRKLAKEQPQVYESDVAMTLNNLGNALKDLHHLEIAETIYQEALEIRRKLAREQPQVYESDVASTLNNLGNVLRDLRRLEAAEAAYQEALEIRRKLAKEQPRIYESDVAMTFNNLGNLQWDLHRLDAAVAAYKEALLLYRKLAKEQPHVYESNVAMTLNNLGLVLRDLRRLEAAEAVYQEALLLYRKLAKEQPYTYEFYVASTLNNLGSVLRDLRRLKAAEPAYQEALLLYRKLAKEQPHAYEFYVASTLNNLGNVLRDLRRLKAAEPAYQEALMLYQSHNISDKTAMALSNLSLLWMESERWEESAGLLKEAKEKVERLRVETLSLDRRMQIFRDNIHIYENLLICLMKLGRIEDALEIAEAGKSRTLVDLLSLRDMIPRNVPGGLADEYNKMVFRARALESQIQQGGVETSRTELVKTHSHLQELVETIRKHNPDFLPHAQPLNLQEIRELAKDAQSTLVLFRVTQQGSFVFLVSPNSEIDFVKVPEFTSKTLNELLVKFEGEKVADGWIVRYYAYRAGYLFSWDEIPGNDGVRLIKFLEQNFNIDWVKTAKIEKKDDGKTIRISTEKNSLSLRLNDGKNKINLTIDGSTIDEFLAKKEKGKLYIYPNKQEREAQKAWQDTMDTTLGTLYEQLLKFIHQRLKGKTTSLVLVPNGGLAILPLHACWWKEKGTRRYLLDEFFIRYTPSLSVFKRCLERERTGRSPEMLLGVADPDPPGNLVFSEWECNEIERMLGSEHCSILWKNQATKKELMQQANARHWQWLHFSCHGQYRLDAPLESAIYFAGGEALTLGEIFESMYLPEAWLVVLSACETGLVDFRDIADEHYGLPVGFLYAGAATVYSSLWMVNDLSTALLMRRVYEGIVKEVNLAKEVKSKPDTLCKVQALNNAQCWLRDITAGELAKILDQEEPEMGRNRMTWTQIAPFTRDMKFGYNPDDRPFNHPYWWAGFQDVGV